MSGSGATAAAIGVDVGGTKVAAGIVDGTGAVLQTVSKPARSRDQTVAVACAAATEMAKRADSKRIDLRGLGAGFPEYVDRDGNLTSAEVLEWDVQPRHLLAGIMPGLPCVVGSDVRCAALAEARFGAGAGLANFLYVSLGTGLSCALVIDGRPVPGARGEAIGLGELEVPASIDATWRGPLEPYASGHGIACRYAELNGTAAGGAADVEAAAREGDQTARMVLASAGGALGASLAGAVAVVDPDAVVVGGGLGTSTGLVWSALQAAFAQRTSRRPDPPPLLQAALGAAAGLIGAALLVPD